MQKSPTCYIKKLLKIPWFFDLLLCLVTTDLYMGGGIGKQYYLELNNYKKHFAKLNKLFYSITGNITGKTGKKLKSFHMQKSG